jgi:cell wall-associated NlpC family hydrolase
VRRLARWLLLLALPCSNLAMAATAGASGSKKSSSKTTTKKPAKPKVAPDDDEAEGKAADAKPAARKPKADSEKTSPAEPASESPEEAQARARAKFLESRGGSGAPSDRIKPAPEQNTLDADEDTAKPNPEGQGSAGKSRKTPPDSTKSERKVDPDESPKKGVGKANTKPSPQKEADPEPTPKSTANSKSKSPAAKPIIDKAGDPVVERSRATGVNATIATDEIADFTANPSAVQNLLRLGLALTERDLTYRYGSADPSTGGMDCSGTVYYLLRAAGLKDVPRDSSSIYVWAQKAGTLHPVQAASLDDQQFAALRPGDLLFWEGTYDVQRDPPISHTMIYLGREKATGARIMVGASDGRSYRGLRRNGVSVFDFKLPKADSPARFVGYARVPGL